METNTVLVHLIKADYNQTLTAYDLYYVTVRL